MVDTLVDMPHRVDKGDAHVSTNVLEKQWRKAEPGDYKAQLDRTPFRNSQLMSNAGDHLEHGRFSVAVQEATAHLAAKVNIDEFLPKDFGKKSLAERLYILLHGNMRHILTEKNVLDNPTSRECEYNMDIAFAQSLRLGAERRRSIHGENDYALAIADAITIEGKARKKLAALKDNNAGHTKVMKRPMMAPRT